MPNDIGSVRGISGHSTNLNTQPYSGTAKPSCDAGKKNPGDTMPTKAPEGSVAVPMK